MRFGWSWVLSFAFATTVAACSGTFAAGDGADAGGDDATEENPAIQGMGSGDSGHDGTAVDAGHHDATAASDTGTETGTTTGGEGGGVAEAGDEGPTPGCTTGDLECSGACVPSDVHNCGACGHDCTNLAHVAGVTSCTVAGACSFPATACAAGWADCDGKPDDGCETDITKPGTCGSCSNVCPANDPVCAGGTCVSGCPTGTPVLCSGTCVDTTSNANDCNGCGLACPNTVTNSQPTCTTSQCGFACNTGYQLCNGTSCVPLPDVTNGLFVSPGATGPTCTETAPCGSLDAAIGLAISGGNKTIIYLDKSPYSTEQVTLPANAANITIQGGWTYSAGGNWTTCGNGASSSSVISAPTGSSMGVSATSGTWTLDTLTVENSTTASTGQSLYGIFQSAGSITLTNVNITVAAGGIGAGGAQGGGGTTPTGSCTANSACTGVTGPAGSGGAAGSQGSYSATGFAPGAQAGTGGMGPIGCNGAAGASGNQYSSCGLATDGDGCGSHTNITGAGNPGCGGTGGAGGTGASGGGSSIGVFAGGTTSFLSGVTIQTGAGGQGGPGGPGGTGGSPLAATAGTSGSEHTGCANTPTGCHPGGDPPCGCSLGTTTSVNGGAAGGVGATGGTGGAGGGGSGGDSFCYSTPSGGASAGGSATCNHGSGGTGGGGGTQGPAGRSG